MTLRLDMDFIDTSLYLHTLVDFKKHIFNVANNYWFDGVRAFVKEATDTVLIDTAMSAISLTAPLDKIDSTLDAKLQSEVVASRKRVKAQPLRRLDGTIIENAYRRAYTAQKEARRNSVVKELSFTNNILRFEYKVVVWQISAPSVMDGAPVDAGFEAFQRSITESFLNINKDLKYDKYLNPFKKKTIYKSKAR